jgi:hypothetical protein
LSGTGGPGTDVTLTPPSMSFDQVGVGSTSATQQITVENATGAAIPVTSIGVSGPCVLSTNACGTALAAHSDCQLLIAFTPTQAGSAVGTLTMVDSAGAQTVRLSGNGAAQPTDALSPNSLTFQGTVVGQISLPQTIALANTGGLLLTSIAATTTGPFQVSSNCGTQLAPTSTCSFTVTFVPTATGAQTGVLTIQDALRTQSVSLSGTGLAPPQIRVNPTSLNFLVQSLGTASAPQTLTISNAGGSPMANIGFQVIGMSVASFSPGATNCGAVLNNGSSCTVQVVFTPVFAGGAAASLAISSSTLGVKAVQAGLTGTGQATNGLNVSPAQMTFTAGTIGQASAAQTVTLSNTSSSAASGLTLTVAPPFSVSAGNCGSMLAAGANCTAGLVFTASDNGSATGMLTATAASLNSAVVILNGVGGTAGSVQLQPALLNYSTVGVGTTSDAQTIAVSNSGPVDLAGFALNTSSGFRVASTTCAAPLVVGASCSASIVFAPTTAGQQTGSLTVASSALAIPAQAVLAGTGFDFAVSILGGSSQTISSGQTARFTLVLTPANGSSGTFAFACGPLPAIAACSFNPPTETVGANTTGNVMVQIATGGSARSMHPSGAIAWEGVSALCGLMLLPVAWRRKRGILLRAFLLALVMSAVVSCAGSGGGTEGPGSNGTGTSNGPVGTYSIPIQVTANGVVHAATVTLTVD